MPKVKKAVESVEDADLAVTDAVAGHRHSPAVKIAGKASEIGDQPPMIAISTMTLIAGMMLRDRRLARAGARMLLAHGLATGVKTAIKRSIDRTRPDHALKAGYRSRKGSSETHELSSFPSGHTAGAVAVAEAVARDYPGIAGPARAAAVSIAAVQIPRCKHFVSDIAAGAVIGLAAERVSSVLVDVVEEWFDGDRSRKEDPANRDCTCDPTG